MNKQCFNCYPYLVFKVREGIETAIGKLVSEQPKRRWDVQVKWSPRDISKLEVISKVIHL